VRCPDADSVEQAIQESPGSFYRRHYALIGDAVAEAQRHHRAGHGTEQAELASVEAKVAETNRKIDRYLTAFANGTLDDELVGQRLAELRATGKQLAARRDEPTATLDTEPNVPDAATLTEVADHITDIIDSGTDQTRKALTETLIAEIKITSPSTLVPVFRIPQQRADEATADTKRP
jgi:site-specific DNA recombinase